MSSLGAVCEARYADARRIVLKCFSIGAGAGLHPGNGAAAAAAAAASFKRVVVCSEAWDCFDFVGVAIGRLDEVWGLLSIDEVLGPVRVASCSSSNVHAPSVGWSRSTSAFSPSAWKSARFRTRSFAKSQLLALLGGCSPVM